MFETIDFQTPKAKEFAHYWSRIRRDGLVPSRNDFNPAEVKSLLSGVSIYEFKARDEITIRLAGTRVVNTLGQEVTGSNYLALWPENFRAVIGKTFEIMLAHPCGLLVAMEGLSGDNVVTPSISVGFPLIGADGIANLLVFHTSKIDIPTIREPDDDPITSLHVTRHLMLDIGAGLPAMPEPKNRPAEEPRPHVFIKQ
jgi:hypothetical protein